MVKRAKERADKLDLDFDLSIEDIKIPKFCPILNIELEIGLSDSKRASSPSLDRIDNKKGYIKDNVCVISNKANLRKANLSVENVERLLKYMKKELN